MRRRHLALTAIVVTLALAARSSAQAVQAPPALTAEDGAKVMRLILTIQANRPFGPTSGYGSLADLVRLMPEVRAEATVIDEQTATLRGHTVRLTRSADRKRFDVAIFKDGSCDVGWFGTEKNVIYAGRPLGCPAQ